MGVGKKSHIFGLNSKKLIFFYFQNFRFFFILGGLGFFAKRGGAFSPIVFFFNFLTWAYFFDFWDRFKIAAPPPLSHRDRIWAKFILHTSLTIINALNSRRPNTLIFTISIKRINIYDWRCKQKCIDFHDKNKKRIKFDDAHGAPGAPWARAQCLFPHKKKRREKKCIDFHDKNKKRMGPFGTLGPLGPKPKVFST